MENIENMFTTYNKPFYKYEEEAKNEESNENTEQKIREEVTKTNTEINSNIAINPPALQPKPLLDPLSVIIKLAIISNKPVGTKLLIKDNIIHIQEPGIFQGISRYINKTNKNDLQYLYNPIELACKHFLNKEQSKKIPKMVELFLCSQRGILKLMETYKDNLLICLCLNYYYVLIDNYTKQIYTPIFRDDELTNLYIEILVFKLNELWTWEKIKIVLDMISFLNDDDMANENVRSLDIFIQNMDKHTQPILSQ
jgi:hypothetical protein